MENSVAFIAVVLAVVGFTGWAVTLIALMRSVPAMADGFSTLHKLSRFIDDRVLALLERTQHLRERLPAGPPKPPPAKNESNAAHESLKGIFGGSQLLEPLDDQPDAGDGLEVVS